MNSDRCTIKGERFSAELHYGNFSAWVIGTPNQVEVRPHANVPAMFDTFILRCGSGSLFLTRGQVRALAKALAADEGTAASTLVDLMDVEALRVANATGYVEVPY